MVKRGDVAATISSSGTIEPSETVDVGAQVAGRITSFGMDTRGKDLGLSQDEVAFYDALETMTAP